MDKFNFMQATSIFDFSIAVDDSKENCEPLQKGIEKIKKKKKVYIY